MQIRTFIDAVLEYTGAPQVDIIAHSMGVTYARRVLKGGVAKAYARKTIGTPHDEYYIGEPLESKVHTFIGIAGGNWGSPHCLEEEYTNEWRMCNKITGFWPGAKEEQPWPHDMAPYLVDLNTNPHREGTNTYGLLSLIDWVAPARVYDKYISEFPGMNASFIYNETQYDHIGVRDLTVDLQYKLVNDELGHNVTGRHFMHYFYSHNEGGYFLQ
jgi:pimeloyl-ACP methyl ester carboxylesterase